MLFNKTYALPLKTVFAIIIVTIFLWTAASIYARKKTSFSCIWREINRVLFCVSFLVILYFTIVDRTTDRTVAIPFIRTIEDIKAQPELIREMIMNAFLFFPIGLTLPYALASQKANKLFFPMIITIIFAFFLTCFVEFIQRVFGIGNAELSDIVMNTIGTAIGASSFCANYLFLNKLKKQKD